MTEDELIEDVKYWKARADAAEAALRGLDTLLDFGDDDLQNTWTFDDLSAIKAAFEAARRVLDDVGTVQVSGDGK